MKTYHFSKRLLMNNSPKSKEKTSPKNKELAHIKYKYFTFSFSKFKFLPDLKNIYLVL